MLVFVGIIITVIMILTEMFPKKFGDLLINIFGEDSLWISIFLWIWKILFICFLIYWLIK
jgi:hypothetical protein